MALLIDSAFADSAGTEYTVVSVNMREAKRQEQAR